MTAVASASGHALMWIVQSSLRGLPACEQLGTNRKSKPATPGLSVEREIGKSNLQHTVPWDTYTQWLSG